MQHDHHIAIVDDDESVREAAISPGRHVPIVFVTAFSDDRVRARAMNAGAICFLTKPFREGDLLEGVRSALRSEPHQ